MDGADPPGSVTALVCAGGDAMRGATWPPGAIPEHDLVIAADSGLHLAQELGLGVDLVVGDLDSTASGAVATAEHTGAVVERHPPDKDATDLELAIDAGVVRGAARIVVVGIDGGRPDHELANLLLLGSERYAPVEIEARTALSRLVVVTDSATLPGNAGDLVSLLPLGGPVRGVHTSGLRFALAGDDLAAGTTRGVSNVIDAPPATVAVSGGTLLAVLPHTEA